MTLINDFIHAPYSLAFVFILALCFFFVYARNKRSIQLKNAKDENKWLRKHIINLTRK